MPKTQQRPVMYWIFAFASFAAFLVVFGGFVRLTRSGLSIVEWNPVSGALPPLTQQAWQTEFAKYQLTPEFQKVNSQMTLDEYKQIFIVEWLHRIFARTAGLIFAIPFFIFVFKKTIPWSEVGLYVLMGILFLAQAVLGWVMVASGLVDRPSVSPYLLTAHLFLALTLLGPRSMDGPGTSIRFSSEWKDVPVVRSQQGHACRTYRPAAADRVRRLHGGAEGRNGIEHMAYDVWPSHPGRLVQPVEAGYPECDRKPFDGCLYSSLVRVHRLDRCRPRLLDGSPPRTAAGRGDRR